MRRKEMENPQSDLQDLAATSDSCTVAEAKPLGCSGSPHLRQVLFHLLHESDTHTHTRTHTHHFTVKAWRCFKLYNTSTHVFHHAVCGPLKLLKLMYLNYKSLKKLLNVYKMSSRS